MRVVALVFLLATLVGCAASAVSCDPVQVPYQVKVPTLVHRQPPAELSRGWAPLDYPVFVSPLDPSAVVGMDKAALDRLKVIIRTLKTRDDAWRDWSIKPTEGQK